MKKLLICLIIYFSTFINAQASSAIPLLTGTAREPAKGDIVFCGDDKVFIIDGRSATKGILHYLWKWQVKDAAGMIPDSLSSYLKTIDDCKPVHDNHDLLITSSGGATLLIRIKDKKVLFYATTPMAHSATALPDNKIAVVNSTAKFGNSLEIYDLKQSNKVLFKDSLYSGHGAFWNEQQNRLFVLGYSDLKMYALRNWRSASPALILERTFRLPSRQGHDLSSYDDTTLIVTTVKDVRLFHISTGKFEFFEALKGMKNIKSVNVYAEGGVKSLIYTQAEESWWTHHIYGKHPLFKLSIPNVNIYKTRIFQ